MSASCAGIAECRPITDEEIEACAIASGWPAEQFIGATVDEYGTVLLRGEVERVTVSGSVTA